jgi:hypothetical protein
MFFLSFFLISCKQGPYSDQESKNFISDLSNLNIKFVNKLSLANATSGAVLSSAISDMQDIRTEVSNLEVPGEDEKLSDIKESSINGMDEVIESFQMLQSGENDVEVVLKIQNGISILEDVANQFMKL